MSLKEALNKENSKPTADELFQLREFLTTATPALDNSQGRQLDQGEVEWEIAKEQLLKPLFENLDTLQFQVDGGTYSTAKTETSLGLTIVKVNMENTSNEGEYENRIILYIQCQDKESRQYFINFYKEPDGGRKRVDFIGPEGSLFF